MYFVVMQEHKWYNNCRTSLNPLAAEFGICPKRCGKGSEERKNKPQKICGKSFWGGDFWYEWLYICYQLRNFVCTLSHLKRAQYDFPYTRQNSLLYFWRGNVCAGHSANNDYAQTDIGKDAPIAIKG